MQTFDFAAALPDRTSSLHTRRAYFRWVDRYLVDQEGWKATVGDDRLRRMEHLPVRVLTRHLTPRKLTGWLNDLAQEGHRRQSLDQARAAVVTLAYTLMQAGAMPQDKYDLLRMISVPPVAHETPPDRLLTGEELRQLMIAARDMATSKNQMMRNNVVATLLCTMALRREELSAAKWDDVRPYNGKAILQIGNAGNVGAVRIPPPVLSVIDQWRGGIGDPTPDSPLIRRIWKGGRVARDGLSPDGIWLIVRNAARHAGMEHVTPDDLRRSAVAGLRDAGVPTADISRLLRHRSVLITERFLAKLPRLD